MSAPVLHVQHASGQFNLSGRLQLADLKVIISRGADVIGFTELADETDRARAQKVATEFGYQFISYADADCALAVKGGLEIRSAGRVKVHDGHPGLPSEGGYGPRYIVWGEFRWEGNRVFTHTGHWITGYGKDPERTARHEQMTNAMISLVKAHGTGNRISIFTGDVNLNERTDQGADVHAPHRLFAQAGITLVQNAVRKYDGTLGEAVLDTIGTLDRDTRVTVQDVKVWDQLHYDHRQLSAYLAVEPKSADSPAEPPATGQPLSTTLLHSSGRFDRPDAAQQASAARLRKLGTLVTYTEANQRRDAVYQAPGWGLVHLDTSGATDCAVQYEESVWRLDGKPYAVKLTDRTWVRSGEYGGKPAAKVRAVVAPLLALVPQRKLVVIAVHMPLDNTPLRADIWKECCASLVKLVKELQAKDPQIKIWLVADWNKNFRQANERALLEQHVGKPSGLTYCWDGHLPAHGGTIGKTSVIDGAFTDLKVEDAYLPKDDDSSDHAPLAVKVTVNPPR